MLATSAYGQGRLASFGPPQSTDEPPAPSAPAAPPTPAAAVSLEELEKLALSSNPTLAGAAALVMQQQGVLKQAGLYPNPTVGYVRSDPDQSGQSQTQGIFFSQDIVTAGKLGIARDAAQQDVQFSQWQVEAQRARVLNDVRIRFYEALGAQQAILSAQELETLAVEGVKVAADLFKAKQGSRPDVLQAELQLTAVRTALRDAQFRHAAAWRQLAAVVGRPDVAPVFLADTLESDIPTLQWEHVQEQLLAASPLLRGQHAEILASEYEVKLARAQAIPNVSVQVVAQRDSTDKFSSVSTFLAVPVPIFNRNQGNILSAEGRLQQQRREYERIQLALIDQLAGSFRQYQSLSNQAEQFRSEILPRAKENLDLTMQAYKVGKFDFTRVLGARHLYFQSKLGYIDSLTELHKSVIEIRGMQLTGGLNPTEAGTALQATPGMGTTGMRSILLQQLQEQRATMSRTLPGALQAGER
jgi:cobalt-zinc-cadmium efflux system outer membrane protein